MTTLHHRTIGREGFDWFRIVEDGTDAILGQGFDAEEARARAKEAEQKEAHNNGGSPTK